MNTTGRRRDGTRRDELRLRVFASAVPTDFTLYEDDGETTGYLRGQLRQTRIAQAADRLGNVVVDLRPAQGSYPGAIERRGLVLEIVGFEGEPAAVQLDGQALPRHGSCAELHAADAGWCVDGTQVVVKGAVAEVGEPRRAVVEAAR